MTGPLRLCLAWFHVDHFPNVTIEILKSVLIHEPMIVRLLVGPPSTGNGLLYHVIDLLLALTRETHQHLRVRGGVADGIRGQGLELIVGHQHDEDVVAHDHATGCLIGNLRMKRETELREERDGLPEVSYRKSHKYLGRHPCPLGYSHI
jgi:hypothetical protein